MAETEFRKGDRVAIVSMPDERDPIPAGTQGTVRSSRVADLGDGMFEQVRVDWDGGRTLMAVIPPDTLELLERYDPSAGPDEIFEGQPWATETPG